MKPLASVGVALLVAAAFANAGDRTGRMVAAAATQASDDQNQPSGKSVAEQYDQIKSQFEAELAASRRPAGNADDARPKAVIVPKSPIDLVTEYPRKMVDLAESRPGDRAARDALLWVIDRPSIGDSGGPYRDQFARAAALLVRHHGDDPDAVRVGLTIDSVLTPQREVLLLGFYATAKNREAKGLARLALARYLARKAQAVVYARSAQGRPKLRLMGGGKVREVELTDVQYADHLQMRQYDPLAVKAEAERLFQEVIAEYGDIPYGTRRRRGMEAMLKQSVPKKKDGKPLTAEERRETEETLARDKRTLGQEAEDRLDVMLNLAIGKPAPEIEGVDMDGKPLRLSDYRGKVVVLAFWGAGCPGNWKALVPHERELVERLKGQPFALLGVACEEKKDTAREVLARQQMTWPNWFDGAPGTGSIAKRYRVREHSNVYVLDAKGVIRARAFVAAGLDEPVDKLLAEMKRPASGHGTPRSGSEKSVAPGR